MAATNRATNSLQEQLRRAVEKLEEKKGKAKILSSVLVFFLHF